MRLFLFSASVFYILGLKIISKVDILPFFHTKSVSTEITTSTSNEIAKPIVSEIKVQAKKDTLNLTPANSKQIPGEVVKNPKK